MRRVLVALLGLGMAAASPPAARPPRITDHEFDPWRYDSGKVVCMHFDPQHPTRGMCERAEAEHVLARVEEGAAKEGRP